MPFSTKNYVFLRMFQISQLKLRNSSFKQNWLFLHQISLRNSIPIKLKYCLSILEILDFFILHYCDTLKELVHDLLQEFLLTVRHLAEVFDARTTHFDVIVIRKMSFQTLTKNF